MASSKRSPPRIFPPRASRTFPLVFFTGLACFIGFSYGHYWHLSTLFENDRFFSHLSQMEREMTFRTEQGLYYSFYKRIVEAPSFYRGLASVVNDSTTEYPNHVNFLQRFNVYPEVFLGAVYRVYHAISEWLNIETVKCWKVVRGHGRSSIKSCVGWGDPFFIYLFGVFSLNGVLLGVLFLSGWLLSRSIFGGLLTVGCFLFNHGEATRVMWTPPLRESFGFPFFVMEMLTVSYILRMGCQGWKMSAAVAGFCTLFILQWQFAQFVLLTQLVILLGIFIFGLLDHLVLWTIIRGLLGGLIVSFVLLFGNLMLATSFYGVLLLASAFWLNPRWNACDCRLRRLAIFVLIQTPFLKKIISSALGQEDDAHVWDILRSKFIGYQDFHTMLYTCAPEFDFIGGETLKKLCRSWLLPSAGLVTLIVAYRTIAQVLHEINCARLFRGLHHMELPKDEMLAVVANLSKRHFYDTPNQATGVPGKSVYKLPNGQRKKYGVPDLMPSVKGVPVEAVYNVAQCCAFMALATLIMRLKLLWTPQMCIVASLLASHSVVGLLRQRWHTALLVGLSCLMLFQGLRNLKEQRSVVGEYNNYPLEEMLTWVMRHTTKDAVFAGPMATMANLHLTTGRPIINHPHYENAAIRVRTKQVYSMYSRKSPEEVYDIHKSLAVDYVVFEPSYCFRRHKPGCTVAEMWDVEDVENRENEPCCAMIMESPEPFSQVYTNSVYSILKIAR